MKVDMTFNSTKLTNDLLKKYRMSNEEARSVTEAGAKVHAESINNELKSKHLKQPTGALEDGAKTTPSLSDTSGTSVAYSNALYYYRFVNDGHYQLFYGHAMNNGTRYFAGYHFISTGYIKAVVPAQVAMHAKLEQVWGRHS